MNDHTLSVDSIALPPSWTLHYRASVASTQDLAREAARRDAGSRQIFLTDFQAAGRGRLGRAWVAPPGSALLFTVLLHETPLALLEHTMCMSISLSQALEELTSLRLDIKWPNDLLIADRKVCGVLAESTDAAPGYVAVGLGLNVTWGGARPSDVPIWATAVDEHVSAAPRRESILQHTIARLHDWLTTLERPDEHERLRREWQERLWRQGQAVTVRLHNRTVHGVLHGTDQRGALMLIANDGEELTIVDGELQLPGRPPANQ